jgi:hypothetical protein
VIDLITSRKFNSSRYLTSNGGDDNFPDSDTGGPASQRSVAWVGKASAPIVAWAKGKPSNYWIGILYLAERLAGEPSLIPVGAMRTAESLKALTIQLKSQYVR